MVQRQVLMRVPKLGHRAPKGNKSSVGGGAFDYPHIARAAPPVQPKRYGATSAGAVC